MADEKPETTPGGRSREDIALEMMKFIAVTTNYGKGGPNTGFNKGTTKTPEEQAESLIELYQKCRKAIE